LFKKRVIKINNPAFKMTEQASDEPKKGRFEPKVPVQLDPPKDDLITLEYLSKCDGKTNPARGIRNSNISPLMDPLICVLMDFAGEHEGYPTYVAIKV
jgi:hypothetical protein